MPTVPTVRDIVAAELDALLRGFDAKLHPRYPKGHPLGGKFIPKGSADYKKAVGGAKAAPAPIHGGRTGKLASAFHENWRQTRRLKGGKFEPRLKKTADKAWIAKHGKDEVDIANTKFADLPSDWQAENQAAAGVVMKLFEKHGDVDLSKAADRNKVGSAIHREWLKRNAWAKGGELDVPFGKLSKEEQDKDIAQYAEAMRLFGAKPAVKPTPKVHSAPGDKAPNAPNAPKAKAPRHLNADEAQAMQDRMLKSTPPPWSAKQKKALNRYSDEDFLEINGTLRTGASASPELTGKVRAVRSAMRPTDEPIVVSRVADYLSLGIKHFNQERLAEELPQLKGKIMQDPGFMSTTIKPPGKHSFNQSTAKIGSRVELHIEIPPGAHAAYLESVSDFPDEQELLLDAGTRYEIVDVTVGDPSRIKARVVT